MRNLWNKLLFLFGLVSECGHKDTCMPLSVKVHCVRKFDFMADRQCMKGHLINNHINSGCHPKLIFKNRIRYLWANR